MAEFNRSEFTIPDFKMVEVAVPAAPAPGQFSQVEFDDEALGYDYDAFVDRVIFTEDTLITENPDPGPGTSLLPYIDVRWWKDKEFPYGNYLPLISLDDRRARLCEVDAPAVGAGFGQLVWEPKGPEPLRVRYKDSLVVDWENPSVAVAPGFPAGIAGFSAQGYLEDSRRPYVLYVPIGYTLGAIAPAALVADQTPPNEASRNMTGQDLIVKRFVTTIDAGRYPTLALDARIWRHLRMMPRLSGRQDERWAPQRERAPLVAFGQDVQVNNHAITIEFYEPIPVDRLGSIKWEIRNYFVPNGTQMIATFCGWKRPQRG